jgi:hypothetical protein
MANVKKGDKVRLVSTRPAYWNAEGKMDKYLGQIVTVKNTYSTCFEIEEDSNQWKWGFSNDDVVEVIKKYEPNDYKAVEHLTFRPYPPPVDLDELEDKIRQIKAKPVWQPEFPNEAWLHLTVKVFRDYGDGWIDVCDDDGNCLKVSKKNLHKPITEYYINKEGYMKAMKDAVLTVAKGLLKANNTVTTLEIKLELRRDYGYYFWTQQVVSDFMDQFAGDGIFTYTNNPTGTYRIYSLATPATVAVTTGPVSSKVTGTLTKWRGRPRKRNYIVLGNTMTRAIAQGHVVAGNFDNVTIGTDIVTPADIKRQKKSPKGYLTSAKVNRINEITVAGKIYVVS